MASAVIGALRVNLSADTAAFEKGLANAGARLGALSKTARAAGAAIATGLGAAVVGLSAAMKGTINQMDAIAKLAQKIGVPVEQLSALAHAADLSGVSLEGLATSFRKLSVNMAATAQGSGGAAQGFKTLGVSVQNADGSLRPTTDVLADIAGKFANLEDGAAKTALAVEVFGRSGADLIPLLNEGAAGLRGMLAAAEALGLTFNTSTAKAAERFNDNLTRLHGVFGGIVTQLTADLLPVLARFTDFLVDAAKNSGLVQSVSGALATGFEGLARSVKFVYDNISVLINVLAAFLALKVAGFVVNMAAAFFNLLRTIKSAGLAMAAFNAVQNLSRAGILLLAGGLLFATGQLDNFKSAIADLGQVVRNALPEDLGGQLSDALGELGLNTDALRDDLFSFTEATGGAEEAQNKLNLALSNTAQAARDAKDAIAEGASVIEQTRDPLEQYQAQIERLSQLQQAGAIDAQTFARAQMMAAASALSPWLQVADTASQALGTLFEENKKIAIAQAVINTLQGITAAIAQYPPPLSYAMAAAQAALGFAQVAKIRQTTQKSTGGGGAGAGSGGGGSAGGAAGASPTRSEPAHAVFVQLQGETFGREQVRGLVEQLKEYQRDGGTIIIR